MDLEPRAEPLIPRGNRIAHRLNAARFVHYAHCSGELSSEHRKQLETLRQLTERLGGTMETAEAGSGKLLHRHLLARMNEVRTTQLIIGQSRKPLWRTLFKETFVHYLLRHARHIDMLILADYDPHVAGQG